MKRFELGALRGCAALALFLATGCSGGGGSSKDANDRDIRVAPISGPVTEAGGEQSFSVVLNAKPKSDVILHLASLDESEGTVSPPSITFTKDNWDAAQTVLVTGVDDAVADGNVTFDVTLTPESNDGGYEGLEPEPVAVLNLDDETAGVRVGPVAGVTSEFGDMVTIPVVLQSEPTADVVLIFGTSDLTEGVSDIQTLTFTPINWNAPQNITVTGVDDEIPDGVIGYSILFQNAFSEDAAYANLPIAAVALGNVDNDTPGIIVSPVTAATRETDDITDIPSVAISVRLSTPPSAIVTLEFNSSNTLEADIQDDDGVGTTINLDLVFNATNWNVPQTVFLIGDDDVIADGDQTYQLLITDVQSTDAAYVSVLRPVVTLVNIDDDSPGILVSPLSGLGDETGGMMSFTVELQTQPTADVTLAMAVSDATEATISHTTHTFTTVTWDNPITVWVAGKDDGLPDGNQPWSVQFSPAVSSDPAYAGRKPANLSGFTLDDGPNRTAIVFDDAFGTEADEALTARGWLVELVSTPAELESAVDAMTADLVIVESSISTFPPSTEASLGAWVTSGGRLILSHWDLDSTLTLSSSLDVVATPYAGHRFVFPEAIGLFDLFQMSEEFPFPLTGQAVAGESQELVTSLSSTVAGRVDSFSGAGSIVSTLGERVIVNGFAPDDMVGTDNDGDGLPDVRELYQNEIDFLLRQTSPATFSTREPLGIGLSETTPVESQIRVFGVPNLVTEVSVSMHIQHTWNSDMGIHLVGPDGSRLALSLANGGSGDDFGIGCRDGDGRVTYDDDAASATIPTTGPVVGTFKPEDVAGLALFDDTDPNGVWTLEVVDTDDFSDFGTIKCWSLHLTF